jgi:hypothetical protein
MIQIKNKALIIGIILIALVQIYLISLNGILAWDEPVYLSNAKAKISQTNFQEDFRFPLLSSLIATIWFFTGESIITAQILMLIITISTLIIFYFISLELLKKKYLATAITITLGITSQFIFWGYKIYADMLSLMLTLLTLLILLKKTDKTYILFAGLTAALAFTARLSTIVSTAIIVLFLLTKKDWFKNYFHFGVGFLIGLIPWLIQGLIKYQNPIFFITAQTAAILEYTTSQSPLLLLNHIWVELTLALLIIPISIYYFIKKPKKHEALIYSLLIANLLFYLFFVNLKLSRYLLAFTPFILLILYFNTIKTNSKQIIYFIIIATFMFTIFSSIQTFDELKKQSICTSNGALKQSIDYIKQNSNQNQTIVSSTWVYFGYHTNLKAYSVWTQEINELILSHDPDWFALSKNAGTTFDNETINQMTNIQKQVKYEDSCGYDITIYKVLK